MFSMDAVALQLVAALLLSCRYHQSTDQCAGIHLGRGAFWRWRVQISGQGAPLPLQLLGC